MEMKARICISRMWITVPASIWHHIMSSF